jgi:co-chaperonin GroES (HSP10)
LHDRVLVRRIDAEERTAVGIIIPDTAKESRRRARCSPPVRAAVTNRANWWRST